MSRKAYYVMRRFASSGSDEIARGILEHEGGSHVCYWHAQSQSLPSPGTYQMLMHERHFSLRDSGAELRPVGHGSGIELGRLMNAERVSLHGNEIIAYLQGMHRSRDAGGCATWLEVR